MLKHLTIQNYVLIDSLDIEFPDGLTIITGETGAGKSILMDAISLLMGRKADVSVLGDASRNCVVEALFSDIEGMDEVADADGCVLLRRVISPAGRSRSFLNDEPVSVTELTDISRKIIDIHEQHQHLLLSDADFRLDVIDRYAGAAELLERYREAWNGFCSVKSSIAALDAAISESQKDRDYREFQYRELESARLRDGELEELEESLKKLSNADEIKSSLCAAASVLSDGESSMAGRLKEAAATLSRAARFIPAMEDVVERLGSCRIEIEDIEETLSGAANDVEVSPQRLAEVEERLGLLYGLMKKHNVQSVGELVGIRDRLDASFGETGDMEERRGEMQRQLDEFEEKVRSSAELLSQCRRGALEGFAGEMLAAVRDLEMPHAVFSAEIDEIPYGRNGKDAVRFVFSANGVSSAGDLAKVASGGELSRVMLALKKIICEYVKMPTMVFDEIDTGVSGRIADRMGKLIAEMGRRMQIFSITHLPQIASQKGAHFLVFKEFRDGAAVTGIRRLGYAERVNEVARMLSGDRISDASVANAETLLSENGNMNQTL